MKTYTTDQITIAMKKAGYEVNDVLKHLESPISERLNTWEDAFTETNTPRNLPFDLNTTDPIRKSANAYYILCVITKALNDGWEIDLTDDDQVVYINWHDFRGLVVGGYAGSGALAGFGYSYSYYAPSSAYTIFGSRLCYKTKADADFCRIKFVDLWMDYKIPGAVRK